MILSINFLDLLNKTIYLLLIFLGGIFIGVIILLFIYLIISLIHKKTKKTKLEMLPKQPLTDPNKVINKYNKIYDEEYSDKTITIRLSSIKILSLDLIKDIATIYNPNVNNPILEISLENLLLLSNHIIDKVDNLVNDIIDSNAFKVIWVGVASFHNIKNFIKGIFRKQKDEKLVLNARKLKLSYVLSIIDKTKNKNDSNNDIEYKKYFILDNFFNNKIKELIREIANEAILVYSNKLYIGGSNL